MSDNEENPVYYSGIVNTILWDIMDIPVVDETGQNKLWFVLNSLGDEESFIGDFKIQLFYQRRI